MRVWTIAIGVALTLACGGAPPTPDTLVERTYDSHRQCGRDRNHPELTLVLLSDGQPPAEFSGGIARSPRIRWGRRTRVLLRTSHNGYTGHTSSSIEAILGEEETPGEPFRMRFCGPTFLGADQRSLIDGRAFSCAPDLCEALDARMANGPRERFDLLFRHADQVDDPLVLEGIEDPTCASRMDCASGECCATAGLGRCVATGACSGEVL